VALDATRFEDWFDLFREIDGMSCWRRQLRHLLGRKGCDANATEATHQANY
jgi:hypothetical protein